MRFSLVRPSLIFTLALSLAACANAGQADWPQWRGPRANGAAETGNPPAAWSETSNIVWKADLPWWSGSTPVIAGGRIYLTSPEASTPENQAEVPKSEGNRNPGGPMLLLLCFDQASGKEIWRRDLGRGNALDRKGNKASPSPVTDGNRVWTATGTGMLAAFDKDGNPLWKRDFQKEYGAFGQMWGYASSPLLYDDRLVLQVLHGWTTDEPSYLFAVSKEDGKTLWKTERPTDFVKESPDSYATPALVTYADGRAEAVTSGGDAVTAHDIKTGAETWRVDGFNPKKEEWNRTITSPIFDGKTVFAPSRRNPLFAIKPGGQGNVTASHVLWTYDKGPDVPSPVSDGERLYIVDDQGIFTCLDAATGQPVYPPERIAGGTYSASLLLAGGKVYATNESAVTTVVKAGPVFEKLAENALDDEYTISTPVASGDRLYIRTSKVLYCLGEGGAK